MRQRLKRKDESWVWFEVTNNNLLEDPEHGYVVAEMRLAERLAEVLRDGICAATDELHCSLSIGVAWSSGDAIDADALVAAADAAMYQAKRAETNEPRLA